MKLGTVIVMIPNAIKSGANAILQRRTLFFVIAIIAAVTGNASALMAQARETSGTHKPGGEANLKLPDLSQVKFSGIDGHTLLLFGLIVCVLGLLFGLGIYTHLKNLPVHKAMREISELIYETCKTYLITQGKFILILEAFIAVIIAMYFGLLLKFFFSASWESRAAMVLPGLESGSIRSQTPERRSPVSRADRIHSMQYRSKLE